MSRPRSSRRSGRACGVSSTAPAPAAAPASRGMTSAARRAPRRSSRTPAAWWRSRVPRPSTTATTAGSSSSRRATTPKSPASCSWNPASTGPTRPRSRTTSWRRSSRRRTASHSRRRPRTTSCASITRIRTRAPAARRSAAGTKAMFERRLYFHVDWLLFGAVVLLAAIGLAMIYSTTYVTTASGGHPAPQVWVQFYALGLGLVALVICLAVDYRMLAEHSLLIYGSLIVLLVFVLVKGQTQIGGQRWMPIGPLHLQPSELGRIGVALLLAMYFGENRRGAKNTGDLILGGIFTAIPLLLIAKQPDLGTAVTLLPVFLGVAFLAGPPPPPPGVPGALWPLSPPAPWKFALQGYPRSP